MWVRYHWVTQKNGDFIILTHRSHVADSTDSTLIYTANNDRPPIIQLFTNIGQRREQKMNSIIFVQGVQRKGKNASGTRLWLEKMEAKRQKTRSEVRWSAKKGKKKWPDYKEKKVFGRKKMATFDEKNMSREFEYITKEDIFVCQPGGKLLQYCVEKKVQREKKRKCISLLPSRLLWAPAGVDSVIGQSAEAVPGDLTDRIYGKTEALFHGDRFL